MSPQKQQISISRRKRKLLKNNLPRRRREKKEPRAAKKARERKTKLKSSWMSMLWLVPPKLLSNCRKTLNSTQRRGEVGMRPKLLTKSMILSWRKMNFDLALRQNYRKW